MHYEKNNREIKGAEAHDLNLDNNEGWANQENLISYSSCPNEYKEIIENTSLDTLVYWKLKEILEKEHVSKQNEILKDVISEVEKPLFAIVLGKTNGNQSKAANLLGCNRNTLHRKLKEFLINPKDIKKTLKKLPHKNDYFIKNSKRNASLNYNKQHISLGDSAEI